MNHLTRILSIPKPHLLRLLLGLSYAFGLSTATAQFTNLTWELVTNAAPWSARYALATAAFRDKLWVLGGGTTSSAFNDVWWTTNGVDWVSVPTSASPNPRWTARQYHGAVVFSNQLWIMGGVTGPDGGSPPGANDVWSSPDGTNWIQHPNAGWTSRALFGAVSLNGKMFVYGGWSSGSVLDGVWSSSDGDVWTSVTNHAEWGPRGYFGSTVLNGKMWVLGGYPSNSDVWWSSDGASWVRTTASPGWGARYDFPGAAIGGRLWVLGGYGVAPTADVWSSANGTNWQPSPATSPMWANRYNHGVAAYRGRLWVLGGGTGTPSYVNDVWRSSPFTNSISGNVDYSGPLTGQVYVTLSSVNTSVSVLASPSGAFTMVFLGSSEGRSLSAFLDANTNGTLDAFEAQGAYSGNPVYDSISGISVTLTNSPLDSDADGLPDYQEFVLGTNPLSADSDLDGLPDKWEVDFGLHPTIADADQDADGDGLRNGLEFKLGTKPNDQQSDSDGIPDGTEYFVHGTNPANPDTDGDGMEDAWEIANSLNPLVNDANEDKDLDGVTNLQEYTNRGQGYLPDNAGSRGGGKSDYEWFFGRKGQTFHYDKNNRLVGADFNRGSNGLSIAYVYDANGNIKRQKMLARDANGNGLPDLWEFQNGLTNNNTGAYADSDGDGWTDLQEWRANSDPASTNSNPTTPTLSFEWPFAPSNMVMAVGQLDTEGSSEEAAVTASGVPVTGSNIVILARYAGGNWTQEAIPIGALDATSIVVGQVTNRPSAAVYVGVRQPNGRGGILELQASAGGWQQTMVAEFPTPLVDLVGVSPHGTLLGVFSPYSGNSGMLHEIWPNQTNWVRHLLDPAESQTLGSAMMVGVEPLVVRQVLSNAFVYSTPAQLSLLDDFENGIINSNLWSITGNRNNAALAAWSVNESGGQLSLRVDLNWYSTFGPAASAECTVTNIWAKGNKSALIRLGRYGMRGTQISSGYSLASDVSVLLGGHAVFQYQQTLGSAVADENNSAVIQLAKIEGEVYCRLQTNGASWISWFPVGTTSGQLTLHCSASASWRAGGYAFLAVDDVTLGGIADVSAPVGSIDATLPTAFYDSAEGYWLARTDTPRNWLSSVQQAASYGGSLAAIRSVAENSRAASLATTNSWIGLYWDETRGHWLWPDGNSLSFSNWAGGQPALSGPRIAAFIATNGFWYAASNQETKASIFRTGTKWDSRLIGAMENQSGIVLPKTPMAAAKLSNASTGGKLVFTAALQDQGVLGILDAGDSMINRVFGLDTDSVQEITAASTGFDELNATPHVSVTFVNYSQVSDGSFFSASPDGRVYVWSNDVAGLSFSARLFSDFHYGFAFHALSGHRAGAAAQGLLGLRSSREDFKKCSLVYWPSVPGLPQPESLQPSPPVARILATPNSGNGDSAITLRLWDAEGNVCTPALQWSTNGGATWFTAALQQINGQVYASSLRVGTSPGGVSHTLVWNAHADLPGYIGSVQLRARATDNSLTGAWSESIAYQINDTASLGVAQTDAPDPVISGSNLTYSLILTNGGPSTAFAVSATDTLPGAVTFLSATASKGSFSQSAGVVNFTVGDLTNSEVVSFMVTVSPTTAGFITNIVALATTSVDPDLADNTSVEVTAVNSSEQLVASPPTLDLGSAWVGASAQGDFTLNNSGLSPITGTASVAGGAFGIAGGGAFAVPASGSTVVTVIFNPLAIGQQTSQVIFTSNGGNRTNIVTGLGIQSALADFAGAPTNGIAPLTVTFTDLSSGSITNRLWLFGDGDSLLTTNVSVSHTYAGEGSFSVSLAVEGLGGTITNTKPGYVSVIVYPPGDANGDFRVTGADSLLINQVLYELRATNHPVFSIAGFANGDVNQDGNVNSADPFLINQVMVGLRPFVVTKVLPAERTNTQPRQITIYGIGFPTNDIAGAIIGPPVNLSLSNVIALSPEKFQAVVPPGGGIGTGVVQVITTSTNGAISSGTFNNR